MLIISNPVRKTGLSGGIKRTKLGGLDTVKSIWPASMESRKQNLMRYLFDKVVVVLFAKLKTLVSMVGKQMARIGTLTTTTKPARCGDCSVLRVMLVSVI